MSTIGEKIKYARVKADMTQERLALGICEKSYISKIENGRVENIDENILNLLKERLMIKNAVLTSNDLIIQKKRLFDWLNLIRQKQIEEATEIKLGLEEMAEESGEPEIEILFSLFSTYHFLFKKEYDKAYDVIMCLKTKENFFSNEHKYYYNFFSGIYYGVISERKKALQHLLTAVDIDYPLKQQDYDLFYVLSNIYTNIDFYSKAIFYGNRAKNISQLMSDNTKQLEIDITLALNYNKIGESDFAREILISCLHIAKSNNNERFIFLCYHNLGCTYLKKELFNEASKNFEEAFNYCAKNIYSRVNNTLFFAYALIGDKKNKEALSYIEEGLALSKKHDLKIFTILLESLRLVQSPLDEKAVNYIKSITIPGLIENDMHLKAIEYYEVLGNYFFEKKKYKKSGLFFKLANRYYKMISQGEF